MRREEPLREAHNAEWHAAADRIAGPAGRHAVAAMRADWNCWLIQFATAAQAEAMQRRIAESGIEIRPAPDAYQGRRLTFADGETS